ncbi:uncharacterized protein LOC115891512 [Sitophilus oryzae]|uniref:Uncharacterized protein LOC115891512 n=1 Tax=Sitophilus oryzae TaxID=7048 RepID=A0A6J2YUP3_SITOR|nr:uncharacterized protein LOC115891512 [Sitophilus oryzae]
MKIPVKDKSLGHATRRVARIVLSTIKKIGNSRGVTLKKIHDYIKEEYPHNPTNIIRLNNTLEKALAFGAVNKRSGKYVLGDIIKELVESRTTKRAYGIIQARRRRRRRGRSRRRRGHRSRHSSRRRSLSCRRKNK